MLLELVETLAVARLNGSLTKKGFMWRGCWATLSNQHLLCAFIILFPSDLVATNQLNDWRGAATKTICAELLWVSSLLAWAPCTGNLVSSSITTSRIRVHTVDSWTTPSRCPATTTTTTNHLTQEIPFLVTCFVMMASGQPVSPAQRRRGRRLRSAWQHGQQSIAMALAAATHHSVQPNAALRGQKTGTRAREEVEIEAHAVPRGQRAPSQGMRPTVLLDPEPLARLVEAARAPLVLPTLAMQSLAGAGGEAVDAKEEDPEG